MTACLYADGKYPLGKEKLMMQEKKGGTTSVDEWGYIIMCTTERLSLAKYTEQGSANHCTFL